MTELTLRLEEICQDHCSLTGSKGANLGDLARGLKVPPGFCLTTEAYELHLKQDDAYLKVKRLTEQVDPQDMDGLEKISCQLKDMIMSAPFPDEVQRAVRKAYKELAKKNAKLGGPSQKMLVAVRSSATAEDLPDASFAGQQESFLNVDGLDNVLDAVKKCWASLWAFRAMHYRTVKGFGHQGVKMAVIIQVMVPAEVAGVMFTANPVSNDRGEMLIEAAPGLGEALVSGEVSGDHYVVEKNGLKLKSQTLAGDRQEPLLTEVNIRQLSLYGFKIEEFYDCYQDVEWAFYKGEFYMLQTRPITTLADEEPKETDWDALTTIQKEMLEHAAERYPEPILPLDGTLARITYSAYFDAMAKYGYDVPLDIDWSKVEEGLFPEFFDPPAIRTGVKRFLYSLLTLPGSLKRDPAAEWANELQYLMEMLNRLKEKDISTLPFEIIYEYIREAFNQYHFFIVMRYEYFVQNRVPSDVFLGFLKLLFGVEGKELQESLLVGLECMTLEINDAMYDLVELARRNGEVSSLILKGDLQTLARDLPGNPGGEEFMEKFGEIMDKYGDRETSMGLGGLAAPNWKDAPEVVFGVIRGMLMEEPHSYQERCENQEVRRKTAEEKLYSRLNSGLWKLLPIKGLIKKFIRQNRQFAVFRENSHYDVNRSMGVLQILFRELGQRFVKRGFINDAGDIFYLTYRETNEVMLTISNGFDLDIKGLQARIEAKKAAQERRLARWRTRHLVSGGGEDRLTGIASSSGVATGPARVVNNPQDFGKLKPGDILVAPYTNPSWTPLFATVAGIVVNTGGAASHASIIAREYGIPAVMGTGEATERIKDGDKITVNGSTGVVLLSSPGKIKPYSN